MYVVARSGPLVRMGGSLHFGLAGLIGNGASCPGAGLPGISQGEDDHRSGQTGEGVFICDERDLPVHAKSHVRGLYSDTGKLGGGIGGTLGDARPHLFFSSLRRASRSFRKSG